MAGVTFDPGVFDGMTPEQQKAIFIAIAQSQQQQQQKPGLTDSLTAFATDKAKEKVLSSLGSSLGAEGVPASGMVQSEAGNAAWNAAANAASGVESMPMAVPAAVAIATFLGGRTGLNMLKGKQKAWGNASPVDNAGRVILGMGTGGLSEVANFLGKHKSTRDVAREHTQDLASQGAEDSVWQQYVGGMRQQYEAPPPDPEHPYGDTKGNKYSSWEDDRKGGLDAANLTGVYGNMKTFGPEWAHLDLGKQTAVTQALIDNNLYESKKGDVQVTDENKAKELYASVLAGYASPGPTPMPRGGLPPNFQAALKGQKVIPY